MDIKTIKDYARLNRKMLSIDCSNEEAARIDELIKCIGQVEDKNTLLKAFNLKMQKEGKDLLRYQNMSLLYWGLICAVLLIPLYIELLRTGEYMVNEKWGVLAYCIFPAAMLLAHITFSHVFSGFSGSFQLGLLIVCAVLSAVLQINLLGSNLNWFLVFIIVGTVVTIIGRIVEYHKRIKKNMKWYSDNITLEDEASALMDKVVAMYSGLGSGYDGKLKANYSGARIPSREPWFVKLFELRKPKQKNEYLHVGVSNTAFCRLNDKSVYETNRPDYHAVTYEEVTNQTLGYESITAAQAKELISGNKFYPLFGMGIPEFSEELEYSQFRHHFDMKRDVYSVTRYVDTYSEANLDRLSLQVELDSLEERYLGTFAWNKQAHTNSAAEYYALEEYQRKKDALLGSIPKQRTSAKERYEHNESHENMLCDEIACVKITTPDGELVGLYCPDKSGALNFSQGVMKEIPGFETHPGLIPVSPGQRYVLYNSFYSRLF